MWGATSTLGAPHRRESLSILWRRTVNLRRPERARHEGSKGPNRLDDTRCTTYQRQINNLFPQPYTQVLVVVERIVSFLFLSFALSFYFSNSFEHARPPLPQQIVSPLFSRFSGMTWKGTAWRRAQAGRCFQLPWVVLEFVGFQRHVVRIRGLARHDLLPLWGLVWNEASLFHRMNQLNVFLKVNSPTNPST